MVAETVL